MIFIISPPRSGSTLLQRMLGSHSAIYTHPEPHLLTPLYYLGYYDNVERAPYDHINAAKALRELCEELPRGEQDYLDALRAYASTIYDRVLAPTGKRFFLDKTPAYALIAPFVHKLFPQARFIILTRNPMAIHHSVAKSFFGGDYQRAVEFNPVVKNYVPAVASFIRQGHDNATVIRYEDLVQHPEIQAKRLCEFLGVEFEPAVVNYGSAQHITKSYGDPITVSSHNRPVQTSVASWQQALANDESARAIAAKVVNELKDDDLQAWGYDRNELAPRSDAHNIGPLPTTAHGGAIYRLKRQVMMRARDGAKLPAARSALRSLRYYCDVLLRDQ